MLKFAFIVIKVCSTLAWEQEEHEAGNNDDDNDDSGTHKAKRHRFKILSSLTTILSVLFSLL